MYNEYKIINKNIQSSDVLIFKASVVHYYTATIMWSSTNSGLASQLFWFFLNQVLQEVERMGYNCIISQKASNIQPYLIQAKLVWILSPLPLIRDFSHQKKISIHKKLNSNTQYYMCIYVSILYYRFHINRV